MEVDPPLAPVEIEFLSGFSIRSDIRRVWPGQPSSRCPWRVAADGLGLVLDVEVGGRDAAVWLRFLCQEFLAPRTIEAMHTALAYRLRGGHRVSGVVVVGGALEITADRNQVSERVLVPEVDAVVLPFGAVRRGGVDQSAARQIRVAER